MRPWSKQNRFIVSYAFLSLLIMPLVCVRERDSREFEVEIKGLDQFELESYFEP